MIAFPFEKALIPYLYRAFRVSNHVRTTFCKVYPTEHYSWGLVKIRTIASWIPPLEVTTHTSILGVLGSLFFFFFFFNLFWVALGLRCCVQAFSSCIEQGLLFDEVCSLLVAVASLVAEHGL